MILTLLPEKHELLYLPSEKWDFETDKDPTELVNNLTETMIHYNGIGLSAIQAGITKNIFVMGNESKLIACINPIIIGTSDERELGLEGCLSFPNLWLKVRRPTWIKCRYQNVKGEWQEQELQGLMARVFLHEFQHLVGLTFTEIVPELSLKMANDKRNKLVKKLSRASS